jgi:AraC family transcriptional regulator
MAIRGLGITGDLQDRKNDQARRTVVGYSSVMTPTELTYRQRLLNVQLFIQEHLDEDLPLDRLAKVAHFSPYHFHRIFRAMLGESVADYIRRIRLESAAFALKHTDKQIVRIALDAGYGTHEAFTRAFRQRFGVSPSEFREDRTPFQPSTPETAMTTIDTATRPVRIETLPARRVAFLRHIGPYTEVGPTFGKLYGWAFSKGLVGPTTVALGLCHDDPDVTPADKLRYDCCIAVPESFQPEGEIGVQSVEGGDYAVLTHVGPYDTLGESWRWLFGVWLPASGREPRSAPPFEIYKNDCRTTPAEKLITEIHVPLV